MKHYSTFYNHKTGKFGELIMDHDDDQHWLVIMECGEPMLMTYGLRLGDLQNYWDAFCRENSYNPIDWTLLMGDYEFVTLEMNITQYPSPIIKFRKRGLVLMLVIAFLNLISATWNLRDVYVRKKAAELNIMIPKKQLHYQPNGRSNKNFTPNQPTNHYR